MGILETVELADFAEKNSKRIRILKTVGLADFAEKNAKRMGTLKNESSNVFVRPSELKPLQCNVLLLCQSQEKRMCKLSLFFRMFLKTFSFMKNSLCHLSNVCQLQAQKVFVASDPYRFQKSPKEYVKNLSEVY